MHHMCLRSSCSIADSTITHILHNDFAMIVYFSTGMLISPFDTQFWSYIKILTTYIVTSTIVVLWIKHSKDKKEDIYQAVCLHYYCRKNIGKAKIIWSIVSVHFLWFLGVDTKNTRGMMWLTKHTWIKRWRLIKSIELTQPMVSFYTPLFSAGRERDQWHEMGQLLSSAN